MNKLILAVLLGVFMLFFSGKPVSKFNCGPRIEINGPTGFVTQVTVHNITTGNTAVYNNPVFPFMHIDQGTLIEVTYYFNGNYHFAVYSERGDGVRECNVENYHDVSVGSITFPAYCTDYFTQVFPSDSHSTWGCP